MKGWTALCIGLLVTCTALQAGPFGKRPKTPKGTLSKAHQEALRHVEALRGIPPSSKVPQAQRQVQQRMEELSRQIELEQQRQKPFWQKTLEELPARKTPQMWLQVISAYAFQYRKFPPKSGQTLELYKNYTRLVNKLPANHPVAEQLKELRAKYPSKRTHSKSLQEWIEELKIFVEKNNRLPSKHSQDPIERELGLAIYQKCRQADPQDPAVRDVNEIRQRHLFLTHTAQEWLEELEEFVAQNGRVPRRHTAKDPQEVALGRAILHVQQKLSPQDPIILRIREIWQQASPPRRKPAEWVVLLEDFVAQNDRLPTQYSQNPQEVALTRAINHILSYFGAQDPNVQRVRQIQRPYTRQPEKFLQRLEEFVAQRGYFPRPSALEGEEWKLYRQSVQMLSQLSEQDPVAVRIRELQRGR